MESDQFYSESMIDSILKIEKLENLKNVDALNLIGQLIDLSDIFDRVDCLDKAFKFCDEFGERTLSDEDSALFHYFRSNAWSVLRKHKFTNPKHAWSWEQPEIVKELYHLRSAIRHTGFIQLDVVRRCQIFTNTANLLNTLGRCTEAVECWNRALEIIPCFAMALGNRGYGLMSYARTLYDEGHAVMMMKFAYDDLRNATADNAFFDFPDYADVKEAMAREANSISDYIDIGKVAESVDLEGHSLGKSKKEREYRRWCLQQRLFLTPLNDLGPYPIASRDIFTLPSLVLGVKEPPTLLGFYNQLKQEYIAARFLYYDGKERSGHHFADRDVLLYNTLDYPAYSMSVEKVKASFRISYSLFDKMAYFINAYWILGIPERSTNFRTIWYAESKKGQQRSLRDSFCGYENLPLRGLYWVSKDLLGTDSDLADTMEPDAEALSAIRNHLEHKYLKVHDPPWTLKSFSAPIHDPFRDSMAYSVSRDELETKSLRLLKLARAGLIYLSLAVFQEEILRAKCRDNSLVMPMALSTWPDHWKR